MSDSQSLHEFLRYPHSRKRQDAFVRMCVRLTIGYLRYLKPKGWTLPLSQQVGGDPIHDLAIDIVGSFLATEHGEPYGKLFNYYRKRGITDFHKPDPTDLWNAFRPLLFHFIRQERSNLLDEEDPQKALLKRAFKDALLTDEYQRRPGQSGAVFVNAARYDQARREECPAISFDDLLRIVEDAYHQSTSRRHWCRAIFEALNQISSIQNFLERHTLLHAVVIVNMKHVDAAGLGTASLPGAEHGLRNSAIVRARTETLTWVRKTVLARYVTKGKLTDVQAGRLLRACENYLIDLAHSADTDSIPSYFREVMPDVDREQYDKNFKNIFDTLIARARAGFADRLKGFL